MARVEKATALFQADEKGFSRGLARMEKRLGVFKRSFSRTLGGLRTVAGLGGLGALVGGGVGLARAAEEALNFEEGLTRLNIASSHGFGSMDALRGRIQEVSKETGLARDEILKSLSAYVALTGDAKGAAQQLELFARVQRGTGAAMDDISSAAAAMVQNLQIDPRDMERAFSILIAGGKAGAVELKNMAGLLAELAPLAARFSGGSGVGGLAKLGSALQLVRQGFGSAEEAATGLQSLMGALVKNASKFEAAGVKVFTKDAKTGVKTLRSFDEIIAAIAESRLAKDPTLLIKALGRKEAEQAYIQLVKNRGAWNGLTQASLGAQDVAEDYAEFQQSAAAQLQKSLNEVKLLVAEAFTPERIREFAVVMGGVAEAAREVAKFLAEVVAQVGEIVEFAAELLPGGGKSLDTIGFEEAKAGGPRALKELAKAAPTGERRAAIEEAIKKADEGDPMRLGLLNVLPHERAALRAQQELERQAASKAAAAEKMRGRFSADAARAGGAPAFGAGSGVDLQAEQANAEKWRAAGGLLRANRQEVRVTLGIDKDTNVKARIDNHRGQALTP